MSDTPMMLAALDDRYVIERELGEGGMAVVYLARDRKLDREVALKVLRPELGAVLGSERFLAEIKISARLDHPHILTLIDSGDAGGFLYYVLPYVRGESLRSKLNRERQLGLDEALAITRQVASALDYAHRQGLVHRDIKPENILIQEGEAMLTDFGIALAVKEAGGNRLTQTGLSLGTPQYMSPEQATGDRGIDARSDVYSLAAVLYEMLAGEPPVTGASAQSMIAKLMTEKPTHLRILRDTVPETVDAAVAKALAKTAADRFSSAGEFARALDAKPTGSNTASHIASAAPRSRRRSIMAGVAAVVLVIAGATAALSGRFTKAEGHATLGNRTQLTVAGNVLVPAISPDGKQLAYATRHCAAGNCAFSIVVQDVGGTTTRTILEGATAAYGLEWSPDRRNLALAGTVGGRAGTYLLSALGGTPRYLTGGVATFFAGGDSLLLGPTNHPDSVYYVRVAALDGVVHDSIRVAGPGEAMWAISSVPGTNWIVTLIVQAPHGLWQVMDRSGKVTDHVVNACTCGGISTRDAVWLARAGNGSGEAIVRIAIDPKSGRLSARQDTMAVGLFSAFSLTSDGRNMVMDDGTFDHSVSALDVADLMAGKFGDEKRIAHASNPLSSEISPDGARILMRRLVPTGAGLSETRYSVRPYADNAEVPLGGAGVPVRANWSDSVTVSVTSKSPTGTRFFQIDVRNGAQRNVMELPDSVVTSATPLANGWAWIPANGQSIVVREAGKTHAYPSPPWYAYVNQVTSDPSAHRVFFNGWNKSTGDTSAVTVLSLDDGSTKSLTSTFGEGMNVGRLADGILVKAYPTQESVRLIKISSQGAAQQLGTIARPVRNVTTSADMKRATVDERDYRADAWMSKVIVP